MIYMDLKISLVESFERLIDLNVNWKGLEKLMSKGFKCWFEIEFRKVSWKVVWTFVMDNLDVDIILDW